MAVNGKRVQSLDDMTHLFEQHGVGAIVELTVVRGDEMRKVRISLVAVD